MQVLTKLAGYLYVGLLPAVRPIPPYICADFASPGYFVAETRGGARITFGGASAPPSPGLATSLPVAIGAAMQHNPMSQNQVCVFMQSLYFGIVLCIVQNWQTPTIQNRKIHCPTTTSVKLTVIAMPTCKLSTMLKTWTRTRIHLAEVISSL